MSQNLIDEALEMRCKRHDRPLQLSFANARSLSDEGGGRFEFNTDAFICPGPAEDDEDCSEDWEVLAKAKI